jgi:GNAT superfamily N-acetyltransferase
VPLRLRLDQGIAAFLHRAAITTKDTKDTKAAGNAARSAAFLFAQRHGPEEAVADALVSFVSFVVKPTPSCLCAFVVSFGIMADDAIIVRRGTDADLEPVRALLRETWHATYDALIGRAKVIELTGRWHAPAALAAQLAATDTAFLVAARADALVGHACATLRAPTLMLGRLYVRPGCQRQGIGRRLLAAAIAAFPDATAIAASVEVANRQALAFYDAEGFVMRGQHVQDGTAVLRLEKPL